MNRQAIYGFVLGVLVIGVGVIAFYAFVLPDRSVPGEGANLPSQQAEAPAVSESRPSGSASRSDDGAQEAERTTESFDDAPPLFADDDEPSDRTETDLGAGQAMTPDKRERIEAIQAELTELSQSGNASPARVGELIGQLRSELGSDEVGGVNLGQLEETVDRAGRIKELAGQMESIAANPSESDRQRIDEIMSEIQRLQGDIPEDAAAYGMPEADGQ